MILQDYESLYEGVDACNLGHLAKFCVGFAMLIFACTCRCSSWFSWLFSCCFLQDHESLYEGVDACNLGHFAKFVNPDLKFCGPPGTGQDRTATLLVQDCQVCAAVWLEV